MKIYSCGFKPTPVKNVNIKTFMVLYLYRCRFDLSKSLQRRDLFIDVTFKYFVFSPLLWIPIAIGRERFGIIK
jgi:hypothetical protein